MAVLTRSTVFIGIALMIRLLILALTVDALLVSTAICITAALTAAVNFGATLLTIRAVAVLTFPYAAGASLTILTCAAVSIGIALMWYYWIYAFIVFTGLLSCAVIIIATFTTAINIIAANLTTWAFARFAFLVALPTFYAVFADATVTIVITFITLNNVNFNW